MGGNGSITAIYNGNRQNPNVSLMFNVYENTKVVEEILIVLKEHNVKATFFVGGCWADDNGDTLNKIIADGNEIANHGYFHKDHKKLSYDKNYEEISLTGVIVKALCGTQPTLFAPPSGSFSENTLRAADSLGYKVIMWSKDTIDWRDKDADLVYKRATKNVTNGDLILMHPKEHTLLALPKILEYYNSIGLKVVTVSENLK
jgi:peptidoglycan/xylan/chitin deacetylase (PgdA/CDA1 family)